jgi:phosphoenolpyruvate synthase/pyruvate phosphate dikinase
LSTGRGFCVAIGLGRDEIGDPTAFKWHNFAVRQSAIAGSDDDHLDRRCGGDADPGPRGGVDARRIAAPSTSKKGIFPADPFQVLDRAGVGQLVATACRLGRQTRPGLVLGICGEHGGDPPSIAFAHEIGLNHVRCSPARLPIARLAATHAVLGDVIRDV